MRILIATFAAAVLVSTNATAQTTILRNATLIDGSGSPPQPNVTITVERGRIVDIAPTPQGPSVIATGPGTDIVDLTGKFVTPGIINGHGHVGRNRDAQLRQYALYGVTTTTSMAWDPDDVLEFKNAQKRGDLKGARILTVKYRFMSAPHDAGLRIQDAGRSPRQGRRDRLQRRHHQGLDRPAGRPPSKTFAGIHRRRDGSSQEAQPAQGRACRRARRRAADRRSGRQRAAAQRARPGNSRRFHRHAEGAATSR